MVKKFSVGLLVLVVLLGPISSFWVKPAQANTGDERRVMLCAAWPWEDGGWSMATPPGSDQNPATSPTNSVRSAGKPELQKVQRKPQKSFWSRFQFFLFNLGLPFGDK